jgi:hypothetical protein
MTMHHENQWPRTFRDLDLEARVRELASLQTLLDKPEPITQIVLSDWASELSDRRALLRGAVWGGIHWRKALGRPQTPSIADGFTIVHEFKELKFSDLGGGNYRDDSRYVVRPAPSVWDATKTSDEYRVGFFFYAGGGGINPNRLTVKLAPVSWENVGHTRAGYRQLDPLLGYSPFGNFGEWVVVPDFEVRHVPYHLGSYIQQLGSSLDLP